VTSEDRPDADAYGAESTGFDAHGTGGRLPGALSSDEEIVTGKNNETPARCFRLIIRTKNRLMNTKSKTIMSCLTALAFATSFAMADQLNKNSRSTMRTRAGTTTTAMSGKTTAGATTTYRTRSYSGGTRYYSGGTRYYNGGRYYGRSGTSVYIGGGYGYPYYGYGYPYYGYYPYSYGYYPYDYSYGYYPYDYSYGYYNYNGPSYGYSGSVVAQVQSRLARAGYYHGVIDGVMGPQTSYAIRAYEQNHGLRTDGVISGSLLRSLGLRY
jgi:Putative peptidoglycan binding domain